MIISLCNHSCSESFKLVDGGLLLCPNPIRTSSCPSLPRKRVPLYGAEAEGTRTGHGQDMEGIWARDGLPVPNDEATCEEQSGSKKTRWRMNCHLAA